MKLSLGNYLSHFNASGFIKLRYYIILYTRVISPGAFSIMFRIAIMFLLLLFFMGCSADKEKPAPIEMEMSEERQQQFKEMFDSLVDKTPTVTLTQNAADKVRQWKDKEQKKYLRLTIQHFGPTGLSYELRLDNRLDTHVDILNEWHGVEVVIDKKTATMVTGTTIDWGLDEDGKKDFLYDNPNEKKE